MKVSVAQFLTRKGRGECKMAGGVETRDAPL